AGSPLKRLAAQVILGACIIALAPVVRAGIVSPRNGGPLPPQFRELKEKEKGAFTLTRAWIERRANQVRGDARYRLLYPPADAALRNPGRAVSGQLAIPVVLGLYSDISDPPFPRSDFDTEFFTGPFTPGTMHQYWSEVSHGLFNLSGTVYDWVPLSEPESYYTGGVYQGLTPGYSHTGDMIKEILDALDPSVDFGQYDNDGPDGIPNSGDDDGYVDVLLVLHPTFGAECNGYSPHMWSHSWTYHSWPVSGGQPYTTNDPAAGGGFIKIDDYIIVPSVSCETGMIEIGVICHELGHALGLPDLYDPSGYSSGIGYWGLMGIGNWNTPSSPAHLCGWSLDQLGWLNPVEIDWRPQTLSLDPSGATGDAVKLPLPTRRFRRQEYTPGNHALVVGYTDAEAAVRDWPGHGGYGNGWHESMFHEFSVNGDRPVSLRYSVAVDAEENYDLGRLLLETGGAVETLGVYTGQSSGRDTIDLGAHLPAGPVSFTLRFEFTSDVSWSNEDGYYDSHWGYSFNIDNVSVHGGGLDYSADFELDSGAWRNGSAPAEYFIVENRRKAGFDANLKGEGMLIWHAENSIAYSALGNSGGASGAEARGVFLEEADDQFNLLIPSYLGGNDGDSGDPYPGSSNNHAFGPATAPRSQTNSGILTPVNITGISYGPTAVTATFRGGMPAPSADVILPDTIDKERDTEAILDIRGSWMQYGASAYLSLGRDTVRSSSVDWRGEERMLATFPIDLLFAGQWGLSVVSGDGQTTTVPNAIDVQSVYLSATVTSGRDYLLAEWELKNMAGIRGCLLYRSAAGASFAPVTPDTLRSASGDFSFTDATVQPGVPYEYRIVTYLNGGREEIYMLTGPFRIGRFPFMADQNHPNPFTRETALSFFVPSSRAVSIDVYDVAGRRVAHLAGGVYGRGTHTLRWAPAGSGAAAGVYFCVFRAGGERKSVKMIYVP
ncbi:MAG: M6 family metalloprotease domain-containing protein, partial [Candidatus Krumholzibacteriaceae bacterium]